MTLYFLQINSVQQKMYFLFLFSFILGVCGSIQKYELVIAKATLQPRLDQKQFHFPKGHPLAFTSNDYTTIHPRDSVHLSIDAGNAAYLLILKPNIDFISSGIHEEVASKQFSNDHPHLLLSKVKAYEGEVFFIGKAGSKSLLQKQTIMQNDKSISLGSAKVIIFEDGEYQPVATTSGKVQHTFLNPLVHGSLTIGEDMFILDSDSIDLPGNNSHKLVLQKRDDTEVEKVDSDSRWCQVAKIDKGPIHLKRGDYGILRPKKPLKGYKKHYSNRGKNDGNHQLRNRKNINRDLFANDQQHGNVKVANIAIAVDCHYYSKFKKGTVNHLIKLYTSVSSIYEKNFNIKIRVQKAHIAKTCGTTKWNMGSCQGYDMYTSLNHFQQWVASTKPEKSGIALNNLLTGCDGAGLGGLGFVGTLCTSSGVAVTTSIQNNEDSVVAHELGHIFGANHDCKGTGCCQCFDDQCKMESGHNFVMNPVAYGGHEFSSCTKEEIMKGIATSGKCLQDSDQQAHQHHRQFKQPKLGRKFR